MKNRTMLIILVIVFIVGPIICAHKPAQSEEKIIELSCSNFFPPEPHHMTKALLEWAREIEKRTGGKVKITTHHAGTLTSATTCYEGVVRGLSDIGHSCLAYTPGRFPLMEVADLPGYPFNAIITSRVANEVYKKFTPKEFADTHVLYIQAHIPGGIFTRDKPVKTLEGLKGMRIRCTGLSAKIVDALGATPVAMPKGEQYDSLRRGVVDGTTGAPNELIFYKVAEVAKNYIAYSPVGYVTAMFVVMNLKKWNSLPPDIQKIFTEVSDQWAEYSGKAWNWGELEGIKYAKKVGHNFIFLAPEEAVRWDKALKPLFDDYVKSMEAKSLPGKAALEYRQQLIDKYSKIYPPLSFE